MHKHRHEHTDRDMDRDTDRDRDWDRDRAKGGRQGVRLVVESGTQPCSTVLTNHNHGMGCGLFWQCFEWVMRDDTVPCFDAAHPVCSRPREDDDAWTEAIGEVGTDCNFVHLPRISVGSQLVGFLAGGVTSDLTVEHLNWLCYHP